MLTKPADASGSTSSPIKTVLTYGTFDLFHIGHLRLLQRLRALGDRLIVGVSSDEFNAQKGKKTVVPFADRLAIIQSVRFVDYAFPEHNWEQKRQDVLDNNVSIFGIGDDWKGKFDFLTEHCEVVYLPRTSEVSSTEFKRLLKILDAEHIGDLKQALDIISSIVQRFE